MLNWRRDPGLEKKIGKIQDACTATEAAERQGQGIALLRSAALLSARVQLDPSELNLIGSAGAGVMGI